MDLDEKDLDEKTHFRACHLCEAICGLEIRTRGDQVVSIKGDKKDPLSRGYICPKATALQDIHTDPDRLKWPVKRVGNDWVQISWPAAFDWVATELVRIQNKNGSNSVGLYAGNPNVHNYGSLTHGGLLRKVLQTKSNYSATSLDQLPHHLVSYWLYGHQSLLPIPDIDHTDFLLIIGANPLASNGSIMTVPDVGKRLKAIQQRGGKFVVLDPRRSETAEAADQHHFIKPGSDAFLLMAIIHILFAENLVKRTHLTDLLDGMDEVEHWVQRFTPEMAESQTGISADAIYQLARALAETERSVCYGRMGVSTQAFGTLCHWGIQVINILIGALDSRGGSLMASPAFGFIKRGGRGAGHFARWHSRVSAQPEFSGELPSSVLAEEILTQGEGQIRALVTMAGNPVLSAPNGRGMDQALSDLDFMVSIDLYINETTRHANVILPPTGPLEHDHYDLAFHRLAVHNTARFNEPIFPPEQGTLHDWEILNSLAQSIAEQKKLDFKPLPSPDLVIDHGIRNGYYGEASGHALSLTLDAIKQHPHGLDLGPLTPSLSQRLCTESGRIQLKADCIVDELDRLSAMSKSVPHEGLLLIGRRHIRSNNSWMHNYHRLVKGKPRWQLLMHPDDLIKRGLEDGASVKIQSRTGEVVTTVIASDQMMQGVVSLPHGWGHQREGIKTHIAAKQAGVSCNDLTDDKYVDSISGNAAFNGVPVTVEASA
jgi:anaerobic selenocysteine-containing dehydrogenase